VFLHNPIGCLSYRFRFPHLIDSTSSALAAGSESGEPTYSCRAYVSGDIIPGKALLRGGSWACWVGYNGREYGFGDANVFEVLTNPSGANLFWMGARGSIPVNAIAGGRTVDAETYYIGRCRVRGGTSPLVVPGKVYQSQPHRMYYAQGGLELQCTDFDFLVCS
jgi:hypothetical protein